MDSICYSDYESHLVELRNRFALAWINMSSMKHSYSFSYNEDEDEDDPYDPFIEQFSRINVSSNRSSSSSSDKLIILDLNGFLCYRLHKSESVHKLKLADTVKRGHFTICIRPGAKMFVSMLFESFDVAVWSSAQKRNIDNIVDVIFTKNQRQKLVFIYDQNDCTDEGKHPTNPYKRDYTKRLSNVWKNYSKYDADTTLLVDDSVSKTRFNPAHTSVHPTEWNAVDDPSDASLQNGGYIFEWFRRLINNTGTVRSFVKNHPL